VVSDLGVTRIGIEGERWALSFLKQRGFDCFQPDWIARKGENYYLFEVKHQDMFEAPPFDGHGLPPYQVSARLDFEKRTGVRSWLLVRDKATGVVYAQSLLKLESGPKFYTKGDRGRVVYPLTSFIILD
jgi:Holliday junction resolvase